MENIVPAALAWALAALAGAFLGSFLPGYLKKKGENLATHEDIEKLVDQVRAVTLATKEIEAKISSDVWDRQKRWELKRDLVVEIVKKTASVLDVLSTMEAVHQADKQSVQKGNPARPERQGEVLARFNEAVNEFEQASSLIGLVCGEQLTRTLFAYSLFVRQLLQAMNERPTEAFRESIKELVAKRETVLNALRNEIGPSGQP